MTDEKKEPKTPKEILSRMSEIEKEFNGFSNIPVGPHEYWDLRNRYQALTRK